jgi:tetratricopeptide (TPR) repeat protein
VEAAIVSGKESQAIAAARRLVTLDKTAAPLIREQAAALLIRTGHEEDVPADVVLRRTDHSQLRYYTKAHPRDPLAWVELALHQTISGHANAAAKSVAIALGLAPNNRHVLRSASRLYLHLNDPERAHDLIARNIATPDDPWLIASEIALADVADRKPRFIKNGVRLLDAASLRPRQLTELAGSIATEELLSGNRRKARKDFTRSLMDPTGSALAQGEWATNELGSELVSTRLLKSAPESAEAMAFHLQRMGKYRPIPDVCERWAEADQFSIRPFEFGAATAGFVERYDKALELALKGLKIRPAAPNLLNAASFALASSDRLEEAAEMLRQAELAGDERSKLFTKANWGLIAFRAGNEEEAVRLYREAIEGFAKRRLDEMSARARVYLAREAIINDSTRAADFLAEAKTAMESFKNTETMFALQRVERLSETPAGPERRKPLGALSSGHLPAVTRPDSPRKPLVSPSA